MLNEEIIEDTRGKAIYKTTMLQNYRSTAALHNIFARQFSDN
jgi:hypothetical protein